MFLLYSAHIAVCPTQGFPKLTESYSHFQEILTTSADLKTGCKGNDDRNGYTYSVQGLVAEVRDTVANG